MKKKELQARLEELGVAYKKKDTVAELTSLIDFDISICTFAQAHLLKVKGELHMELKQVNMLKDALYYLNTNSKTPTLTAKGVIVGIVSAYMSMGMSFEEAIGIVNDNLPKNATYLNVEAIPKSWLKYIK